MTATQATAEGGHGPTLRQQESRAGPPPPLADLHRRDGGGRLPILWTIFIAFRDLRLRDIREVGIFGAGCTLENFIGVFTSRGFFDALLTTLIYSVVGTALAIGLGLVAALIVRAPFRGGPWCAPRCSCPTSPPSWRSRSCGRSCSTRTWASSTRSARTCSAGSEPIPFLSQRSSDVTIFGVALGIPTALLTRHRLPGVALLPVRVPLHPRPPPGGAGRPRRGGQGGWRVAAPALPLHPAAAALGSHRAAGRPALHLDLQRVRRHLPRSPAAGPAPRWCRSGSSTGSPAVATSARRRPSRSCSPASRDLPLPLLPVLRQDAEVSV